MTESLRWVIREAELAIVARYFPPASRVLEIGGGSGWQAGKIASWGCDVTSIDVAPETRQFFPVTAYDGRSIPASDESFDVVFSSHVLEHVVGLPELLVEMTRVLKPGGVMVHVMPSATWRLWTTLAHYLYLGKRVAQAVGLTTALASDGSPSDPTVLARNRWRRIVWSGVHGSRGNAVTELVDFNRWCWRKRFVSARLTIAAEFRSGIFYTGYKLLPSLRVPDRARLARCMGSSTNIFVLHARPRC